MFADSLSTFNEEFEMRMENIQPNETPQGIYEEIVAKAESVVSQRKAKTVFMEIQSLRDDDKNVGIVFIFEYTSNKRKHKTKWSFRI